MEFVKGGVIFEGPEFLGWVKIQMKSVFQTGTDYLIAESIKFSCFSNTAILSITEFKFAGGGFKIVVTKGVTVLDTTFNFRKVYKCCCHS